MLTILAAAFTIMLASLAGVLFLSHTAQNFLQNRLSQLVAFSAGVFLFVAGALALEVFHLTDSVLVGVLLITAGYVIAWALHALLPETHHHHNPDCHKEHGKAAKKLIIGDAIHNVGDGIVLVVAFLASPTLGIAATISIFIHEVLQEISEFFVLRQAGYTVKKALLVNFAVSSTILIGVLLGYFALASHELEILLLALSAGFFTHIVVHDLLPKRKSHATKAKFFQHLSLVLVGALLMGSVSVLVGESHEHGDLGHQNDGLYDRYLNHDDHIGEEIHIEDDH